MQAETGILQMIQRDEFGHRAARIETAGIHLSTPGRYVLAVHPNQPDSVLGQPLFLVGHSSPLDDQYTPLLGPIPASWRPGDTVVLHPPAGRGFQLPGTIHHLALAAFGSTPARLLPLVQPALESGAEIVLFTPSPALATSLPPAVEIQPLNTLAEILPWATFLAIEIPLGKVETLRRSLGLGPHEYPACPGQALIWTAMPCAAVAQCGACAVQTRAGKYKLTCQEGPVFDLHTLRW